MDKSSYFSKMPNKDQKKIINCNILEVKVGTTGLRGGDSGHGGRTYFSLEDLGGTDMSVIVDGKSITSRKIELCFGGDAELNTFIEALEFAARSLKQMAEPK